ncbi:MAG: 2Fe-2S iron-sulfur cluster binding domain-containing protein, partial [Ardenticatenaceae bacterium]|nr:2Fe-2S iron-sulfur cluster binding domain-containing protein [Ardenticatenaceae bacterium]
MRIHLTQTFPNYIQLRDESRTPGWLWELARAASVNAALILVIVLIWQPAIGLFILWSLVIPTLPIVFLTIPGFWRNVCPLAAFNQTPRQLNFSRALTPPNWLNKYGYVIGMVSFFVLASSRKWLFNKSGPASGLLLLGALLGAFIGGFFFKGKSGWCSSICPLYPVQRLYNQTPLKVVPNHYCTPCVGCTKNCYDFNPGTASLADLEDSDRHYTNSRKFFTAAMPGFILAFFTLPNVPAISPLVLYAQMLLYMLLSVALFTVADTFIMVSANKISAIWGASAFTLFYWFVLPGWLNSVASLADLSLPFWAGWIGRGGIIILALVWVQRTYMKERNYVAEKAITIAVPAASGPLAGTAAVTFQPDDTAVSTPLDESLLNIAENNNLPIEAGCRMGICGADLVTVLEGMENLSPMSEDERCTLERMGMGKNTRLACMCRVKGDVCVSLGGSQGDGTLAGQSPIVYDESVEQVVIIGNGIAGVTAADTIRRHHPDCAIHLIGREKHPLYNRMGIGRLIYGRSAMSGLYLKPETWYE